MTYPLRLHRSFIAKPWAGDRLARLFPELATELPPSTGEVIELCDLPSHSSVVANGPWRGRSIAQLLQTERASLMGDLPPGPGDFPLCIKLLDTSQPLSIQDHPGDQREGGNLVSRGKSECWLVLDAAPEAVIYQGLKPGITPAAFEAALAGNSPIDCLNARTVRAGDFLYNEAGMIHAIGAGIALLEVQQNSGITWRLWDFPREGGPREMHVQQGLSAARFDLPLPPIQTSTGEDTLLVAQGPFGVRLLQPSAARVLAKEWPGFTVFTCVAGICEVTAHQRDNLQPALLKACDTVLFPAGFDRFELYPEAGCKLAVSWARE
jgi:mannose-6-phosphate isomerase